jgi:hypothetical protein
MRAYSEAELVSLNTLNTMAGSPWLSTAVELAEIEDETDFNQLLHTFRSYRREFRARKAEEELLKG